MSKDSRPTRLLIKNVQIFDGISDHLFAGHVLTEGRTIAAVDTSPIAEVPGTTSAVAFSL